MFQQHKTSLQTPNVFDTSETDDFNLRKDERAHCSSVPLDLRRILEMRPSRERQRPGGSARTSVVAIRKSGRHSTSDTATGSAITGATFREELPVAIAFTREVWAATSTATKSEGVDTNTAVKRQGTSTATAATRDRQAATTSV